MLIVMGCTKYTVDTAVQLVSMYDLEYIFGDTETITFTVAVLCIIVTYILALSNYKQIAYLSRAVIMI